MKEPNYKDYWNWRGGCQRWGYEVELSLYEWCYWWNKTKQYENRGRGKTNVCMGRKDVEKPFSIKNIKLMNTSQKNKKAGAR